jgi:cholestenol delta-isomerase
MSRKQLISDGGSPKARTPSPSIIDSLESRSFDFFRSRTVAEVAHSLDYRVWNELVIKLSHSEPAVKHSMLALSLLHERCHLVNALKPANMEDIMAQHQKALTHSRKLLDTAQHDDMAKVLVVCMLFVCYGNLTGQYATSQVHLKSGLKILQQYKQKLLLNSQPGTPKHSTGNSAVDSLAESLACLDLQAMTFSDSKAPYPYSLYPMLSGNDSGADISSHSMEFSTLGEANTSLITLTRSYFYLLDQVEKGEVLYAELMTKQSNYLEALEAWDRSFQSITSHNMSPTMTPHALILQMYRALLKLLLKFDYAGSECHWDPLLPSFSRIVDLASELGQFENNAIGQTYDISFSFNIGIIIPLFVTATRCRDFKVRREAIKLLRSKRRIEGVWDSIGAAAVAEKVMQIEEDEAIQVGERTVVPEEARVHATFTTVELEERSVFATCLRQRQDDELQSRWEEIKFVVRF